MATYHIERRIERENIIRRRSNFLHPFPSAGEIEPVAEQDWNTKDTGWMLAVSLSYYLRRIAEKLNGCKAARDASTAPDNCRDGALVLLDVGCQQ